MRPPSRSADLAARRWHAVVARDPRHYAGFVYTVRSTGVYCPYGATRHQEVARAIGRPRAARACAANPAALVVPRHRVLRADGDPDGYRWGTGRKRKLLAAEATHRAGAAADG